jgi:hypothetical protein
MSLEEPSLTHQKEEAISLQEASLATTNHLKIEAT